MQVNRIQVADAIRDLDCDPFTCAQVMFQIGLEYTPHNTASVMKVLRQFEKRKWIANSINNLYWRTFGPFTF